MVLDGIRMHFGSQNQVFCASPPGSFSDLNRGHFLETIFLRFCGSFGASWGPSWASRGSLGRPLDLEKYGFTIEKPHFLKRQLFGSLRLLMALLGSSCPLLGLIWSQNGPQNGPQNGSKSIPKMDQFGDQFGIRSAQEGGKTSPRGPSRA